MIHLSAPCISNLNIKDQQIEEKREFTPISLVSNTEIQSEFNIIESKTDEINLIMSDSIESDKADVIKKSKAPTFKPSSSVLPTISSSQNSSVELILMPSDPLQMDLMNALDDISDQPKIRGPLYPEIVEIFGEDDDYEMKDVYEKLKSMHSIKRESFYTVQETAQSKMAFNPKSIWLKYFIFNLVI